MANRKAPNCVITGGEGVMNKPVIYIILWIFKKVSTNIFEE
jgi:hypothetical protein